MTKQFFIPMKNVPTVTAQQHRIGVSKKTGKGYIYDSSEIKIARNYFEASLLPFVPDKKITSGVRLTVKWLFPITGEHTDGEYKLTRPDTDNLQKLLKDSMTKVGFWKDDALVCSEIIEKFYSDITGVFIKVEEL